MHKLSKHPTRDLPATSTHSPQAKFTFQPHSTRNSKLKPQIHAESASAKNLSPNKSTLLSKFQPRVSTQPKPSKHIQEIPTLPVSKFLQSNSSLRSNRYKIPATSETASFNNSLNSSAEASKILNYTAQKPLAVKQTASKKIDWGISSESLLCKSPSKFGIEDIIDNNKKATTRARSSSSSMEVEKEEKWEQLTLPVVPAKVLKHFVRFLSTHEYNEVVNYNEIWFIGAGADKVKTSENNTINHGYDDDRGDYKVVIGDHIAYRYEVVQVLGKGSFGIVLKAYDHNLRMHVALKILRNKQRFHQQGIVEIKILKFLKEKDTNESYNIVHIADYFQFRHHLCLTFEMLSINLYDFLKGNNFHGLSINLIKRFAFQILQTLRLLKRYNIIHCDLKPENILLKQPNRSSLKVIDFGSSCFEDEKIYTYIQSRFYRAPEIILGLPYSTMIDMWSFGCILAELFTGYPLFCGESEAEQILCIMEVLGMPSKEVLAGATRKQLFFDPFGQPKIITNSRGKKRYPSSKSLRDILRGADNEFIELVEACLEWDPMKRMTPDDAIRHHWVQENLIKKSDTVNRGNSAQHSNEPRHEQKLSLGDISRLPTSFLNTSGTSTRKKKG
ncbi:unnamed protein product [Blepharisma stoltei]|uniref:dual-specificity kinase n=1 Tax=Blepharisma stoltei TaxID=1481888 RepID=A0AAU9JQY7_9CILI|nr:unnamed protein product [Blepharisma stoltei]